MPSGIVSIPDSSSPDVEDLLKAITTKMSVFKGRHMQGLSKQFNANLTLTFDEFNDKLLNITKRKLSNKASMLVMEDLTIAYNWGPVKTPSLTGLEDEEDFESIYYKVRN